MDILRADAWFNVGDLVISATFTRGQTWSYFEAGTYGVARRE
jgi:hypothetical protein